jgi:hypothetical protein
MIIGAQKAGTSALFDMLHRHSRILKPAQKELHLFDHEERYKDQLDWYWSQFPEGREGKEITFEATPNYISTPGTAGRIAKVLPDVKLVAVLRNPVDRAFSAWNMFRDFKDHHTFSSLYDERSFEDAVREEINGTVGEGLQRYLEAGHYAVQLKDYFKHFDADSILILGYSELKESPAAAVASILNFLDLKEEKAMFSGIGSIKRNVRSYPGPLADELREELVDYFRPLNQELDELLGRSFRF